jgi:ferritin-like metal-binding protein YciE
MKLETIDDVFTEQLADLYSAEQQLVKALPKVAQAASDQELRDAVKMHLDQTRNHITRLEQVFSELGTAVPQEHCKGMEGLIAEGEHVMSSGGGGPAMDAALIAAAQRIEHYEIAGYGTARTLADQLGKVQARELLDQTLQEEGDADKKLTKLATGGMFSSGINEEAQARR